MSIKSTILGFLSWKPFTGYDLKKFFAESDFLHWSGNSNQIYKALVSLHKEGYISQKVEQQENLPAKKIYSITESGIIELRKWVESEPEIPQIKNTFLAQLAWADCLDKTRLTDLINKYEDLVHTQLLMAREKTKRDSVRPDRTERESFLWEMILKKRQTDLESELRWVTLLRNGLHNK